MELISGGLGVEALEGAEAALGPDGGTERPVTSPEPRFGLLEPDLIITLRERMMRGERVGGARVQACHGTSERGRGHDRERDVDAFVI